MERLQHRLGILGQVHQVAALHRLHDNDRLAVLLADLVALAALDGGVVVVHVVELDLHHLDVRIVRQDLLQHLRPVVEGNAHVANFALCLQREGRLIGPALLVVGVVAGTLGVHQVEVKVIYTAGIQLALEEGADVRLGLEVVGRELVRQNVAVARIPAGQARLQRRFALLLQIAVSGVKVVEPRLQKGVHHLCALRQIHFAVFQSGQAHKAKTKILLDPFHFIDSFPISFVPHQATPGSSYPLYFTT